MKNENTTQAKLDVILYPATYPLTEKHIEVGVVITVTQDGIDGPKRVRSIEDGLVAHVHKFFDSHQEWDTVK